MGRNKEFQITGTIEERRGFLHIQLNAGVNELGKRNRKSVATGLKEKGNQRRAANQMRELIDDLMKIHDATGILNLARLVELLDDEEKLESTIKAISASPDPILESDYPFSQIIKEYLRYTKTRVDGNTHHKYAYACKRIYPYFDERGITIKTIKPKDVIDYFADMMDEDLNAENGTAPLKATTLAAHNTVLQETMRYAKEVIKIIEYNTIADVKAPKKLKRVPSFYNKLQINEVFRKVKGHVMEPVVILTATYGLRRQEVLGLKWSAVDFEDRSCGEYGSLMICHTVTKVGNDVVKADKTKTTSSLRTLPLTKNIAGYLKRLYAPRSSYKRSVEMGITIATMYADGMTEGIFAPITCRILGRSCLKSMGCLISVFMICGTPAHLCSSR